MNSFRDLDVYKMAREQSLAIFLITQSFANDENFSLTDQVRRQVRRSSRAANALIAESWARRQCAASFTHKINEALGEAMETQAWLNHAEDCKYITSSQHRELDAAWQSIGAMLNRMIERAGDFCKHSK